jgi:hypothetical protein
VGNKWGRHAKRHQEKHREYFETLARQIIKDRKATVDLGVVTFEVRLRRWRRWLEIDSPDGSLGEAYYLGGRSRKELVLVIADYLIMKAANFPGAQIPRSS